MTKKKEYFGCWMKPSESGESWSGPRGWMDYRHACRDVVHAMAAHLFEVNSAEVRAWRSILVPNPHGDWMLTLVGRPDGYKAHHIHAPCYLVRIFEDLQPLSLLGFGINGRPHEGMYDLYFEWEMR